MEAPWLFEIEKLIPHTIKSYNESQNDANDSDLRLEKLFSGQMTAKTKVRKRFVDGSGKRSTIQGVHIEQAQIRA